MIHSSFFPSDCSEGVFGENFIDNSRHHIAIPVSFHDPLISFLYLFFSNLGDVNGCINILNCLLKGQRVVALNCWQGCTHCITTYTILKNWNTLRNLEDKVSLQGVNSDTIHIGWVQGLLAWMFHIEGIIKYIETVEVGMMERIRKKKMLPSLWVQLIYVVQYLPSVRDMNMISHNDTLDFYHVHIMDRLEVISMEPLEVDSLILQVFLIQYHGHCIQSGTWIKSLCLFNFWLLIKMNVFTVYFEQWDPGGHLNMFTPVRSYRLKKWDPGGWSLVHWRSQHA